MPINLGSEPTAIIWLVYTVVNAIQVAVIDMPTWAHTVIAVVLAVCAALLNRSQVTPVTGNPPNTALVPVDSEPFA